MPWKSWTFSEVMHDSDDGVSLLLGALSLLPFFAFAAAAALFAVKPKRETLSFLVVCMLNFIVCTVLKKVIKQPRPSVGWDNSPGGDLGYGMPSAHAQSSFGVVVQLWGSALLTPFKKLVLILLAAAVSVGRVYNGYHTAEQVAAGAVCGVVVVAALRSTPWVRKVVDWTFPVAQALAKL